MRHGGMEAQAMTSAQEIQNYLRSIYDGALAGDSELAVRLAAGKVRRDEFTTFFNVYDRHDKDLPSLGMFITVKMTYLLFMPGLTDWAREVALRVWASRQVNDWLEDALTPPEPYTHITAAEKNDRSPQVQRLLITGTLVQVGFAAAKGWVEVAKHMITPDKNVVAEIILQVLREGPLDDIRAFVGANQGYDPTELTEQLGDLRTACAATVAARAPELFFFYGHKLGLKDVDLAARYLDILHTGGAYLTAAQKEELMEAAWLPVEVRELLQQRWRD